MTFQWIRPCFNFIESIQVETPSLAKCFFSSLHSYYFCTIDTNISNYIFCWVPWEDITFRQCTIVNGMGRNVISFIKREDWREREDTNRIRTGIWTHLWNKSVLESLCVTWYMYPNLKVMLLGALVAILALLVFCLLDSMNQGHFMPSICQLEFSLLAFVAMWAWERAGQLYGF